jgi:uncharacterized protein YjbI with pentapeptide repeats
VSLEDANMEETNLTKAKLDKVNLTAAIYSMKS